MISRHVCFLLSITAITVVATSMSASAEVTNSADAGTRSAESVQGSESVGTQALSDSSLTPVSSSIEPGAVDATEKPTQDVQASPSNLQPESDEAQLAETSDQPAAQTFAGSNAAALWAELPTKSYRVADNSANTQPVPGKVTTSAAALKTATATESEPQTTSDSLDSQDSQVAQFPPIDPGRATRSGSSYIGAGVAFGGGDALFEVLSKIGLTRNFSVRPSVAFNGDGAIFFVPLTYDFSFADAGLPLPINPYVGIGGAFATGSGVSDAAFLVTGGVDFPLTSQLTATGRVNFLINDGSVTTGTIGLGYNFSGLFSRF